MSNGVTIPWTEREAQPARPRTERWTRYWKEPRERKWWEEIPADMTMPWQAGHWFDRQPLWSQIGGGIGGLAGAGALAYLGGTAGAIPAAAWGASRLLTGAIPGRVGTALGGAALKAGMAAQKIPRWIRAPLPVSGAYGTVEMAGEEQKWRLEEAAEEAERARSLKKRAEKDETEPELPKPGGPDAEAGYPEVVQRGGYTFYKDPTTGEWRIIPETTPGLSAQQQMAEAERERAARMRELQEQFELEKQRQAEAATAQDRRQSAAAAQTMANMYAADPYKYWAQLGVPTPEAVARLTGGAVGPGGTFKPTPLSVPSSQWWGNLLPSEQQQVMGGLNWMGVNPEDWLTMYQRMIPGLGARQIQPAWAR